MNGVYIGGLSLPQKIGQIVMPRLDFRGSDPLPHARELVQRFHVGGFIVFGGERRRVREATEELQAISPLPLFFACDAERGVGQVVSGTTRFPFTMSLGAIGDEGLAFREAGFIAEEMKDCGLNLLFAPVVDVNTNPKNPIINIRSYGDDPLLVSRLGSAFIRGCQDRGILVCAKHFPGHGGVSIDSHIALPLSLRCRDDFWRCDLIPFREAIKSGVASIMVAHIAIPDIDPTGVPATLSSEMVRGLLIRDLGFKGLVITDSLRMGALEGLGNEKETAHLALLAGCDIVLDPKEPLRLLDGLVEMVKGREGSQSILDKSVEKIVMAKRKWFGNRSYKGYPDRAYGEDLIEEIARRSICRIKGGRLRSRRAKVYVLDVAQKEEGGALSFLRSLAEAGVECEKESVSLRDSDGFLPNGKSVEGAVICLVYTSVAAWKGHTDLPESFKGFLRRVSDLDCERILVSLGSPYVVQGFKGFDTVLCSFDRLDACERALADVLLGRLEPQGRLPVELDLKGR